MNMAELTAVVIALQSQVKEEREARVKAEEKTAALELQLVKLGKDKETDLVRLTAMNTALKAELKKEVQGRQALDLRIQQESKKRQTGVKLAGKDLLVQRVREMGNSMIQDLLPAMPMEISMSPNGTTIEFKFSTETNSLCSSLEPMAMEIDSSRTPVMLFSTGRPINLSFLTPSTIASKYLVTKESSSANLVERELVMES